MESTPAVITLRVDLKVRSYDQWRRAFEGDAAGRAEHGARRYRIFRPVGRADEVSLDLDFDSAQQAEAFLQTMGTKVWPDPDTAPAKVGEPVVKIVELVETRDY